MPCPSAADPGRNTHRTGAGWTLGTVTTILENPRYTGRQVWNRQRTDTELADPANVTLGHKSVQRWNLPDGWVISHRPAHPALVSEDNFVAAQDINAARRPRTPQDEPVMSRYLLAGLLACGLCGRRMESAWSNGKAAAGPGTAARARRRQSRRGRRTPTCARAGSCRSCPPCTCCSPTPPPASGAEPAPAPTSGAAEPGEVIGYLREHEITLTWNPGAAALQARATGTAKTVTVKAS